MVGVAPRGRNIMITGSLVTPLDSAIEEVATAKEALHLVALKVLKYQYNEYIHVLFFQRQLSES